MLAFYREYPYLEISPQAAAKTQDALTTAAEISPRPVAEISTELLLAVPWGLHDLLRTKVKDLPTRAWYASSSRSSGERSSPSTPGR